MIDVNKAASIRSDSNSMGNSRVDTYQNIHGLGVSYICNFLDRVGFTILEFNSKPDHHYQVLAEINDRTLLIAVRTAYHPEVGIITSASLEKLIRESNEFNALPHFAGLSVLPLDTNEIEIEGVTEGRDYKVLFNGITAVKKSEILAANG